MAAAKKTRAAKPKPATKKTADKAKQSSKKRAGRKRAGAKQPGKKSAKGPRLTAAEQNLRDSLMIAREAQGWPIEAIAAEAGLTITGARRAIKSKKEAPEVLMDADPVKIVEELVQGFKGDIADLQAMSLAYADWHPSAAVGAKKSAAAIRTNLQELYQSIGVLPHELGQLRVLIDIRAVVVELVGAVDSFVSDVDRITAGKGKAADKAAQIKEAAGGLTTTLDRIGGIETKTEDEGKVPA